MNNITIVPVLHDKDKYCNHCRMYSEDCKNIKIMGYTITTLCKSCRQKLISTLIEDIFDS